MTSLQVIEQLYEAFKTGNNEQFQAICDADLEWIQNAGFPGGGHHKGAGQVIKKVFQKFSTDWEYFNFDIDDIFESADGSRVTVTGKYSGRHKRTGKMMEAAAAHIYDLKNHKVKRFRQFTDTAMIVAAVQG